MITESLFVAFSGINSTLSPRVAKEGQVGLTNNDRIHVGGFLPDEGLSAPPTDLMKHDRARAPSSFILGDEARGERLHYGCGYLNHRFNCPILSTGEAFESRGRLPRISDYFPLKHDLAARRKSLGSFDFEAILSLHHRPDCECHHSVYQIIRAHQDNLGAVGTAFDVGIVGTRIVLYVRDKTKNRKRIHHLPAVAGSQIGKGNGLVAGNKPTAAASRTQVPATYGGE
jgi:hypothetical protein